MEPGLAIVVCAVALRRLASEYTILDRAMGDFYQAGNGWLLQGSHEYTWIACDSLPPTGLGVDDRDDPKLAAVVVPIRKDRRAQQADEIVTLQSIGSDCVLVALDQRLVEAFREHRCDDRPVFQLVCGLLPLVESGL